MQDEVNTPPHYKQGHVECIDAMKAALTKQEFEGYLKGNVIKYIWRCRYKDGLKDMLKAQWYLCRLIGEQMDPVGQTVQQPIFYKDGSPPPQNGWPYGNNVEGVTRSYNEE